MACGWSFNLPIKPLSLDDKIVHVLQYMPFSHERCISSPQPFVPMHVMHTVCIEEAVKEDVMTQREQATACRALLLAQRLHI